MSNTTKIAWADATFSPWIGCTKVSPGCASCYASTYGQRFGVPWGPGKPRRRTSAATWRQVERWNKAGLVCPDCSSTLGADRDCDCGAVGAGTVTMRRQRVFPSLCDPFDPEVPIFWLADYLDLIRRTPNLDHLILTKRPEQWQQRLCDIRNHYGQAPSVNDEFCAWLESWLDDFAPPNAWLGVSAEDQPRWDERVPILLGIPAKVRMVSVEPMLGPINMALEPPCGKSEDSDNPGRYRVVGADLSKPDIDWIIFGGESGPNARPCDVGWIRDGVRQCREAGVPAFVKQWGSNPWNNLGTSLESKAQLIDPKGGDPDEWPEDLRVRKTP